MRTQPKDRTQVSHIALISHASKVMLKFLQARLQQYVNQELPDVKAGFRKGRGTRDQIANICCIIEKARNSRKMSTSALLITPEPLTMWIRTTCGKFFKRWECQTTFPSSWEICTGQEATVRTRHETMDWFEIGKGAHQGCILSPCLFNLYAEYIMRNVGLEEAQAGIKIPGEISITSDMQMTPLLWQKVKGN